MSKIKLLSIAVIGLLIINIGIITCLVIMNPPHHTEDKPPMKQDEPKNMIINILNFNEAQIVEYFNLIEKHKASIKLLDDSIKLIKHNLYQTLNNKTFEDKDSLINYLNKLQKQIELIHYQHFAEIKNLCKPNQLEAYKNLTNELGRFFSPTKKNPPPERE